MNIVFIVGSYYPNYSAVGKCAGNVADELSKSHKVTVISLKDFLEQDSFEYFNNQSIIRIDTEENRFRNKFDLKIASNKGIKRKIAALLLNAYKLTRIIKTIFSNVSINKDLAKAYINALKNIKEPIDVIIPTVMPFESVVSASMYNSKVDRDVIIIPYMFDHFAENQSLHRFQINMKIKFINHLRLEKKVLDNANAVLIMHQLENHFRSEFDNYDEKFITVEHPMIKKYTGVLPEKSGTIKFVYAGSFYKTIRNPEYMLKLFDNVLMDLVAEYDLYTFGNCDEIVRKYVGKNKSIVSHGRVSTEKANQAVQMADFLVAVGNSDNSQVPSKIFEYISFGKPIIYFYSNKDDINLKVLKKYPLTLLLKQDKELMRENVVKLREFCILHYDSHISFEEVEELFKDAAPKYTSCLMEQIVLDSGMRPNFKSYNLKKENFANDIMARVHRIQLEMSLEVKRICQKHQIKYSIIAGTLLGAVRHGGFIPWDDDMDIGMMRDEYEKFIAVAKDELKDEYFIQTWETDLGFALPITKIKKNGTIFIERNSSKSNQHNGIYIDIFPFDNVPANTFRRKYQSVVTYILKRFLLIKLKYEVWEENEILKKLIYKFVGLITKPISAKRIKKILNREMKKYNKIHTESIVTFGGSYGYWKETLKRSWLENLTDIKYESFMLSCPQNYIDYLTYFYGDYMTPPPEDKRYNRHKIIEIKFQEEI